MHSQVLALKETVPSQSHFAASEMGSRTGGAVSAVDGPGQGFCLPPNKQRRQAGESLGRGWKMGGDFSMQLAGLGVTPLAKLLIH